MAGSAHAGCLQGYTLIAITRRDTILRIAGVQGRTGLTVATIYRRDAAGTFPERVRMGPKMVGRYESDIDA